MSLQRQFHFPPALFTCLMKNWGVPEIIAGELLHSGQNFRGIYKSIKNDIFAHENSLYLHYSHKGVIVRVEETISKLQNWHNCKNFRGTLPCNLSKCAVFHTWYYDGTHLKMILCVNNKGLNQFLSLTLLFYLFAQKSCKNCRGNFANILKCNIWSCSWFPPSWFTQIIILRVVPL